VKNNKNPQKTKQRSQATILEIAHYTKKRRGYRLGITLITVYSSNHIIGQGAIYGQ
jgi:hypothetical protein